jgi:hypothetical protein
MISQIFLALENYSYVGDIKGFIITKEPVISTDIGSLMANALTTRFR